MLRDKIDNIKRRRIESRIRVLEARLAWFNLPEGRHYIKAAQQRLWDAYTWSCRPYSEGDSVFGTHWTGGTLAEREVARREVGDMLRRREDDTRRRMAAVDERAALRGQIDTLLRELA